MVAIEAKQDLGVEFPKHFEMSVRESRAHERHGIRDTRFTQGDDVHETFKNVASALSPSAFLHGIVVIKNIAFVEQLGFRAIDVLPRGIIFYQLASRKPDDLAVLIL